MPIDIIMAFGVSADKFLNPFKGREKYFPEGRGGGVDDISMEIPEG